MALDLTERQVQNNYILSSEPILIVPDFKIFVYTAVHVIVSFSVSFSLLCFLFLFIGIPKARWDAKK